MADPDDAVGRDTAHRDSVLVVMEDGRDRKLLVESLASVSRYFIEVTEPGGPLPADYDVCLLDGPGLVGSRDALAGRIEQADPVFLPHLLLAGTSGPGDTPEEQSELLGDSLVDDVLTLPTEQAIVFRRVENLLTARRASVRLSEREQQYEELVELAPEAILLVRDGAIHFANRTAVDLFGVDGRDRLDDRPIGEFVVPADREALEEFLATIASGTEINEFRELRMESALGRRFTTEISGVQIAFEGEQAVQLLVRDVTAQRERQVRLDLFARAIETSTQGVSIADAQQDGLPLIYVNEAFTRITGYDRAEVLGRNCRFLQGPETDEETVMRMRKATEASEPVTVEILNYRADGTPFWNSVDIVPVEGPDGEVTHFLGLQRDITGRREREERLNVLDRVLRHNIRNRANVIRSYAEKIQRGDSSDVPGDAGRIVDAIEELLTVSEQVREFQSLISTEERSLESLDLSEVVRSLAETVARSHPDLNLTVDLPETAPARVHRTLPGAFAELVDLAIQEGGGNPEIRVEVRKTDETVEVEIVDVAGTLPESDLRAMGETHESPLDHARGLEVWLVRWAVLYSNGSLSVSLADPRRLVASFARAPDGD